MLSNHIRFKCQFPLCKHLYLPDPKGCSGIRALCFTTLSGFFTSTTEGSYGGPTPRPLKTPYINDFFPFYLGEKEMKPTLDHTLFHFLRHQSPLFYHSYSLFLSVSASLPMNLLPILENLAAVSIPTWLTGFSLPRLLLPSCFLPGPPWWLTTVGIPT